MNSSMPWHKVEAALDALLALPINQRPAAIARLTAADAAMRAELESLLKHIEGGDELLDSTAVNAMTRPPAPGLLDIGQVVAGFRIISMFGRGRTSETYKAERVDVALRQIVALKLIRTEAVGSSEGSLAQLQALAQLEHPGIARSLGWGVTANDWPYMAREFIDGHDIIHHCMAKCSSLQERLELFGQVCDAVAYAHRHRIVHGNLKPGNIFVNSDGRIKLLDFGIAKPLAPRVIGDAAERPPLIPAYAAPEQLIGGTVTMATDVYGLGATLYELLSGSPPKDVSGIALGAALLRTRASSPIPPSQIVSAVWPVAARRLRGDLDAICAMALRVEPAQRYAGVRALADDLLRYQNNEPVRARVGTRASVLRRFIRW